MDTFYTSHASSTIGRFTAVEADIHALFKPDTGSTGQLQDYYELISEQMEDMTLIDSLLQTASGQDSLDLLVRRENALDSIGNLSQANSALAKSVLQARSAAANSIIVDNNAITATDIWEQNEKTVNHIFLNTVAKGIPFNDTQFNLLMAIAEQCPYQGGTAVFRARALLEIEVDDETACSQTESQALMMPPVNNQAVSTPKSILLYPNPADNTVTVKMLTENEAELELSIYNLYGQTVARHKLQEGTIGYSFDTSMLPQGLYLVRVMQGKEAIFTTRLVIAR